MESMNNKVLLTFCKLSKIDEVNTLVKDYRDNEKFDLVQTEDVNAFLEQDIQYAIIIFSIHSKQDFQDLINFFKKNKDKIKNGYFKLAYIATLKNAKVDQILKKFGCSEFFKTDIKAKSLSFKINFWFKQIGRIIENEKKQLEKNKSSSGLGSKLAAKTSKDLVRLLAPIESLVDCWFIAGASDCRKVLRSYLIKSIGPSPHVGKWEEQKNNSWIFVLKETQRELYIESKGNWIFEGKKPEFNWKEKKWFFTSDTPALYFLNEDEGKEYKFSYSDEQISLLQNSEFVIGKKELLIDSAKTEFNIEGNKEESDNSKDNFEQDQNLENKMKGDVESQDKIDKNLEGKVLNEKNKESNFSTDSKVDRLDQQYKGRIKTEEDISHSEKEKQKETSSAKNDYEGKTNTDFLEGQMKGALGSEKEDQKPSEKSRKSLVNTENEDFMDQDAFEKMLNSTQQEQKENPFAKDEKESSKENQNKKRAQEENKKRSEKKAKEISSQKESKNESQLDTKDSAFGEEEKANQNNSDTDNTLNKQRDITSKDAIGNKEKSERGFDTDDEQLTRSSYRKKKKIPTYSREPLNEQEKDLIKKEKENLNKSKDGKYTDEQRMLAEPETKLVLTAKESSVSFICVLEDINDEQLIAFSEDHLEEKVYGVICTLDYLDAKVSIRCEAEKLSQDDGFYTFKLINLKKEELDAFIRMFEGRQGQIDLFMKQAKGVL
ncbi:MAG: hypothetical protein N4A33_13075 [Bacteriovoracaceae bacterium]|jgi:hypothetical protein|nr:hypothetical protein [Bacteriovoracaceae bacterium]